MLLEVKMMIPLVGAGGTNHITDGHWMLRDAAGGGNAGRYGGKRP